MDNFRNLERPLEHLPENIQAKLDGHANMIGDEAVGVPVAGNRVEAQEQNDHAEENQTAICLRRLEGRSEGRLAPTCGRRAWFAGRGGRLCLFAQPGAGQRSGSHRLFRRWHWQESLAIRISA